MDNLIRISASESGCVLHAESMGDFNELMALLNMRREEREDGTPQIMNEAGLVSGYYHSERDNGIFMNRNFTDYGSMCEAASDPRMPSGYVSFQNGVDTRPRYVSVTYNPFNRSYSFYGLDGSYGESEMPEMSITEAERYLIQNDAQLTKNVMSRDASHLPYTSMLDMLAQGVVSELRFQIRPAVYGIEDSAFPFLGECKEHARQNIGEMLDYVCSRGTSTINKMVFVATESKLNIAIVNEAEFSSLAYDLDNRSKIISEVTSLVNATNKAYCNLVRAVVTELTNKPGTIIINLSEDKPQEPSIVNILGERRPSVLIGEQTVVYESASLSELSAAHMKVSSYGNFSGWKIGSVQEKDGKFFFDVKTEAEHEKFQDDQFMKRLVGENEKITMRRATPTLTASVAEQGRFCVRTGESPDAVLDRMLASTTPKADDVKEADKNAALVNALVDKGLGVDVVDGKIEMKLEDGQVFSLNVLEHTPAPAAA